MTFCESDYSWLRNASFNHKFLYQRQHHEVKVASERNTFLLSFDGNVLNLWFLSDGARDDGNEVFKSDLKNVLLEVLELCKICDRRLDEFYKMVACVRR